MGVLEQLRELVHEMSGLEVAHLDFIPSQSHSGELDPEQFRCVQATRPGGEVYRGR